MSRKIRSYVLLVVALATVLWAGPDLSAPAEANNLSNAETVFATDFVTAGYGGIRGVGSGSFTVSGVTGPVTKAYLYWHGPSNNTNPTLTVTFAGMSVTGTNIGLSDDNCWSFDHSDAFRADVTSLVTGNGMYAFSGMVQNSGNTEVNGASLIVFFDDGNAMNNRDVVLFHGNDSNQPNPFDATGWNATLSGINYTSGTANLQAHISDGQNFGCNDETLILNGTPVPGASGEWLRGDSVPNGPTNLTGGLWDIKNFDITSYLSPGPNTLTLTSASVGCDCLSLIVFVIDLPAGAAPTAFDKCLQDARTENILRWNSTTGAWQYVRNDGCEVLLSGTGTVTMDGPLCQLRDFSNGNFVSAYINTTANFGKARIRLVVPGGRIHDMFDPHTDDECACTSSGETKTSAGKVDGDGRIRRDGRVY